MHGQHAQPQKVKRAKRVAHVVKCVCVQSLLRHVMRRVSRTTGEDRHGTGLTHHGVRPPPRANHGNRNIFFAVCKEHIWIYNININKRPTTDLPDLQTTNQDSPESPRG
eukprot:6492376-Amphidinium_carterae.2